MRTFGYTVVVLGGLGIIGIGVGYLLAPGGIAPSFGLRATPPATDPFMLVKGVRDVASGLIPLALAAALRGRSRDRAVAVALLAGSVTPIGDASIVLGSGGSVATALGVHAATAAALVLGAAALLRAGRATRATQPVQATQPVRATQAARPAGDTRAPAGSDGLPPTVVCEPAP